MRQEDATIKSARILLEEKHITLDSDTSSKPRTIHVLVLLHMAVPLLHKFLLFQRHVFKLIQQL